MANTLVGRKRIRKFFGKIKEVAGAVTGRDDLKREGQAQQDKADSQREAAKKEAEAEAARKAADANEAREEAQR